MASDPRAASVETTGTTMPPARRVTIDSAAMLCSKDRVVPIRTVPSPTSASEKSGRLARRWATAVLFGA